MPPEWAKFLYFLVALKTGLGLGRVRAFHRNKMQEFNYKHTHTHTIYWTQCHLGKEASEISCFSEENKTHYHTKPFRQFSNNFFSVQGAVRALKSIVPESSHHCKTVPSNQYNLRQQLFSRAIHLLLQTLGENQQVQPLSLQKRSAVVA